MWFSIETNVSAVANCLVKEFNKPLNHGGNIACYCGRCHNQSAFGVKSSNWVTLFFIPVVPFYFGKRIKCNICGASGDIDSEAERRLASGQPIAIGG